jgi:bacillithiol system protein YtxJ
VSEATLTELTTIDDLDRALAESSEHPVLLFKHSNTCPLSSRVLSQFRSYLQDANPAVKHHLITVQTARSVSDEIEARLRVEHESPQAILVRDGRSVWDASHLSITASSLKEAVGANSLSSCD